VTEPAPPPDDTLWQSVRLRATAGVAAAYTAVLDALVAAVEEFLSLARAAVLGGGGNLPPDVAAWPGVQVWARVANTHVRPAIERVYEAAYAQATPYVEPEQVPLPNPVSWLPELAATVTEAMFPAMVFTELLDALTESTSHAETYPLLRARIADVLRMDALDRAKRHKLAAIRRDQAQPGLSADDHQALTRQRATIEASTARPWQDHVRVMARTPAFRAWNTATYAGALVWTRATGRVVLKRWVSLWAVKDPNTRESHRLALGQTRPVDEPYLVGVSQTVRMRYPHDPRGPVEEVANCRCVQVLLHDKEGRP
jgi:hypothetical protein